MRPAAKILLALIVLTCLAGVLGAGILIVSNHAKTEVVKQKLFSETKAVLPTEDELEIKPITEPPDYEDDPGSGYGGGENSVIDQASVSEENKGWTHIPWLVGKPREVVEKSFGDPQNTNENPTTPVWSYSKDEEHLCVSFGAILMDELLGQGRTFEYPMIVDGVTYSPQIAQVKIKEIIPEELANKSPYYQVVFHEKRQQNLTNRYVVTWVNGKTMIVIKSRTTSSATSEERYYNRERGLHEWRYQINEEVLGLWFEGQVESYRQESTGIRENDPNYGKPNEITGHIHIGKIDDWEVYF